MSGGQFAVPLVIRMATGAEVDYPKLATLAGAVDYLAQRLGVAASSMPVTSYFLVRHRACRPARHETARARDPKAVAIYPALASIRRKAFRPALLSMSLGGSRGRRIVSRGWVR